MIAPEFNVDLGSIDRAIETTAQRAKRLGPAFRELRKPMRGDQRSHAKEQQGPDAKWPARSPITEARRLAKNRIARRTRIGPVAPGKKRRRSTPARILGRLPGAVVLVVGELYIRMTSRADAFGAAQQQGAQVGHGRKVKLPARAFLWISQKLADEAARVLGEYVVKGLK